MGAKKSDCLFYEVWPAAWGPIGAVAGPAGLKRLVLPHYQFDDLLGLLAWEHPGSKRDSRPFERLIASTRDYFNGKKVDFGIIQCDLPAEGGFSGKVLRTCRAI
ncbi:MAG: hypothetical protein KAU28_00450, partial [Phycisphaerae bacterium]|nr:hypothetical protein [Phycisphaerae bacterium]